MRAEITGKERLSIREHGFPDRPKIRATGSGKLLSYEAALDVLGENIISAHSGEEALKHLMANEITIILCDVRMPDLDGFELADMIRQHPQHTETAIIFVLLRPITSGATRTEVLITCRFQSILNSCVRR
jgi:response regulator RpfG family c-di-GMP phosphodiesterase